jgi:prepilin-type N-terminal cleavage/methylation domain-containing protein
MRLPIARSRRGFTLLELLVVISIMIVITTLAVLFLPKLDQHKGVPNAVTQLHGWANLGKQYALRDKSPRGIRLVIDPANPSVCTQLQYIEQPEPFAPGGRNGIVAQYSQVPDPDNPLNIVTAVTLYSTLSNSALQWEGVAQNDYLEITLGANEVARIKYVVANSTTLVLDRDVASVDNSTQQSGFRVLRAPRPLMGEPALQMNKDVYIDMTHSIGITPAIDPFTGNLFCDILFNSSGFIGGASSGQIFLVIGHVDRYNPAQFGVGFPGDCLILAFYTRTGRIAPYSVNDTPGGDPYAFARTGETPGL